MRYERGGLDIKHLWDSDAVNSFNVYTAVHTTNIDQNLIKLC